MTWYDMQSLIYSLAEQTPQCGGGISNCAIYCVNCLSTQQSSGGSISKVKMQGPEFNSRREHLQLKVNNINHQSVQ